MNETIGTQEQGAPAAPRMNMDHHPHVEVTTDGTVEGTRVESVFLNDRTAVSAVIGYEAGGVRYVAPGAELDSDETITIYAYGRVVRGPETPAYQWGPTSLQRSKPLARADRADRYAGRYFSRPDGSGLFRAIRGATGAMLHIIRPDDTLGLSDPDELEALLLSGTLVARPDVTPPEGAGV